jgi:hypothetical protein
MAYDKAKYDALRSLEVPRPIALALADDESPLNLEPAAAVANLAGGADLPTTVAKVNALLASLRAAGYLAS